jgi:predicted GIY-YIG superfamily endonuclease
MRPFFVYILKCCDGSYYVGHTDELEQRIAKLQDGTFGGYTSTLRPVTLVYSCEFQARDEAFARERQLKGWSRAKKEALIRGDFDRLHQLARRRPSTPGELRSPSAQDERK